MTFKTEERIIGGTRYRVRVLPSSKARAMLVRLLKVAGPSFGTLGKAFQGVKKVADLDTNAIGGALGRLAENLDEADLEYVISTIMAPQYLEYSIDGSKWPNMTVEVADMHFAGKTDELLKLVAFALEVNYSSFFRAYEDAKGALGNTAKQTDLSA